MSGGQNKSSSFSELVINAIRQNNVDNFTMLPGVVRKIDGNLVEVQITLKREVLGVVQEYPIISKVPIQHMAVSETQYLRMPIKKGTQGSLIFAQRSLDAWIDSNGEKPVDPNDDRLFDISDATFHPGLFPKRKKINYDDDTELRNNKTSFIMNGEGQFEMKGATGGLVDTMETLTKQLQDLNTNLSTINENLITLGASATSPVAFTAGGVVLGTASAALTPDIVAVQTALASTEQTLKGMKL